MAKIVKDDIEIREFKDMDISGGTLIECFPTVSMVGTIVANYLIDRMELDQISAFESYYFPPISIIYNNKPKFPARIYSCPKCKVTVMTAESQMPPELGRAMALKVLEWAKDKGLKQIISVEGIVGGQEQGPLVADLGTEGGLNLEEGADEESEPKATTTMDDHAHRAEDGPGVWAVAANEHSRKMIEAAGIAPMDGGMIAGVSGVLLNEGRWTDSNVITLVAKVQEGIPDAGAAARVIEAVNILIPEVEIKAEPLYEAAAEIEAFVSKMQEQAQPVSKSPVREPDRMFG